MRLQIDSAGHNRWAVLLHGFTRKGPHLAPLAEVLNTQGIGSVRPDLGSFNWFRSVNNAKYLDRVAHDINAVVSGPMVVIGHSAGGAAAAHLASRLNDVAGIVFVDANESPTHLIARAWPHISTLPKFALCAPPSRCNRHGAFASWAQAHDVPGCIVEGMGHGDIEGGESPIYRILCGDVSTAATRSLVRAIVVSETMKFLNLPDESDPWRSPEVHRW